MRSSLRTVLTVLGFVAAALAIGFLIGWFPGRSKRATVEESNGETRSAETSAAAPATNRPDFFARPTPLKPATNQAATTEVADASPDGLIKDWEDRLDQLLDSDIDEDQKAKKMLEMYPKLPPEGQAEAAGHMVNLTPDEDFGGLGKILINPKTPGAVLEVVLADSLNRPNSIKLPLFLNMARNPEHPQAAEAKDLLELYLDEDYGDDWAKWEEAARELIKEDPD